MDHKARRNSGSLLWLLMMIETFWVIIISFAQLAVLTVFFAPLIELVLVKSSLGK
jgi:hypothetical protein